MPTMRTLNRLRWLCLAAFVALWGAARAAGADPSGIHISRPAPDARGGQAYRLTYTVDVPLEVFWRFKTDFDNDFVETNPGIASHRLIAREDNRVVTENRYSRNPDMVFRWKTTVFPDRHRLEYELIDTNQPGNKFHYGAIQLYAENGATRVVQTAFFDFHGASMWAWYPWYGGMRAFLKDTVEWEQQAAVRLRDRFE